MSLSLSLSLHKSIAVDSVVPSFSFGRAGGATEVAGGGGRGLPPSPSPGPVAAPPAGGEGAAAAAGGGGGGGDGWGDSAPLERGGTGVRGLSIFSFHSGVSPPTGDSIPTLIKYGSCSGVLQWLELPVLPQPLLVD